MLSKISNKLAQGLMKNVKEVRYDQEVYVYGFELVLSTLACWTTIIIASIWLSDMLSGIVFITVFSSLRIFAGGYHAESYSKCFCISNLFYLLVMVLKNLLSEVSVFIWLALFSGCVVYIIKKTPIINPNQPLGEEKRRMCRQNIKRVLGVDIIVVLICTVLNRDIANLMILSIALVTVLMLISDKHTT